MPSCRAQLALKERCVTTTIPPSYNNVFLSLNMRKKMFSFEAELSWPRYLAEAKYNMPSGYSTESKRFHPNYKELNDILDLSLVR